MSFFHKKKKMSQNVWATIMPIGPVTLILYWPKRFFSAVISVTDLSSSFNYKLFSVIFSCNNVAPVTNLCLGRVSEHLGFYY